MPKRPPVFELRISYQAQRDIRALLDWSEEEFGANAALRYEALLVQALRDIAADPKRPGSKERPELLVKGARTYHLEFSRERVKGPRVKTPRHLLLYRLGEDGVIEVGRVIHDSRDLRQHLPERYRSPLD